MHVQTPYIQRSNYRMSGRYATHTVPSSRCRLQLGYAEAADHERTRQSKYQRQWVEYVCRNEDLAKPQMLTDRSDVGREGQDADHGKRRRYGGSFEVFHLAGPPGQFLRGHVGASET